MPSQGYTSSPRVANAPGGYYEVFQGDFGVLGGPLANPVYNAGAGSLAMGTAFVKITWITAQGESLPSAEGTIAVSAGSGAVTVTKPTTPANGAAVIGWRVYSAGVTNTQLLNVPANFTNKV